VRDVGRKEHVGRFGARIGNERDPRPRADQILRVALVGIDGHRAVPLLLERGMIDLEAGHVVDCLRGEGGASAL
jgi:hypothetical protein